MRDDLLDGVRSRLAGVAPTEADDARVEEALRASGRVIGSAALGELTRAARAALYGAGPLQHLLDDPAVTDVLVNGPGEVWIDRGHGLERVDVDVGDEADVRLLAVRLAATGGSRLDDASPLADARLPDGTRLHAVLAPVAERGAAISLRVLRTRSFTLDGLVRAGSIPVAWEPVIRGLVGRRATLLLSGGTGTGKTTLLAALLGLVPPDERIVCVEEARELVPDHPHVVPLVVRRSNVEGRGGVGLTELVRAALRMRPDRIVLGECRGAEVRDVLMAMNTGHEGGMATVHANDVAAVPARLEALAALAGMSPAALASQAASGVDVVLHLRRGRAGSREAPGALRPGSGGPPDDRRRYLAQIGMLDRGDDGLRVRVAAAWDGASRPVAGPAWSAFAGRWAA